MAVTNHIVSLVLVRTDDGVQRPVYYVSKSLQEAQNSLLTLGEGSFGHHTCDEETPSLFPSTYHGGSYPTPSAGTTSKI